MLEDRRLELHELLVQVLGSRNVYFQPPESTRMSYPAIVYNRSTIRNTHASDGIYRQNHEYQVTVIDADPDSPIVDAVSKLPSCRYGNHFTKDGLNHDVFQLYYC